MRRCIIAFAIVVLGLAPSLVEAAGKALVFPRSAVGLRQTGRTDYETRAPGWGFSVRYGDRRRWADIYVYDKGRSLQDGDEAAAAAERESANDEIKAMLENGRYRTVDILERGPRSLGGTVFAKSRAEIVVKELRLDSYVYVAIWSGKFLKVRLSMPAQRNSDALADAFVAAFVAAQR